MAEIADGPAAGGADCVRGKDNAAEGSAFVVGNMLRVGGFFRTDASSLPVDGFVDVAVEPAEPIELVEEEVEDIEEDELVRWALFLGKNTLGTAAASSLPDVTILF